jgi:ferritin
MLQVLLLKYIYFGTDNIIVDKKLSQLIDESIKLELNVSKIYMFFCNTFPEDSEFWRKLVSEEKEHADLIKSGKGTFLLPGQFPSKLLAPSVQTLCKTNNKLVSLLKKYNEKPPSRESVFNTALNIEKSAGELQFQLAMEKSPTSSIMEVLQILNKGCKDHANRILAYMSDKGIENTGDK